MQHPCTPPVIPVVNDLMCNCLAGSFLWGCRWTRSRRRCKPPPAGPPSPPTSCLAQRHHFPSRPYRHPALSLTLTFCFPQWRCGESAERHFASGWREGSLPWLQVGRSPRVSRQRRRYAGDRAGERPLPVRHHQQSCIPSPDWPRCPEPCCSSPLASPLAPRRNESPGPTSWAVALVLDRHPRVRLDDLRLDALPVAHEPAAWQQPNGFQRDVSRGRHGTAAGAAQRGRVGTAAA